MENIFDQHASSDIVFVLEDFEGPIALLVELCKQSGLDIRTVKISSITDQYLQHMQGIADTKLDLDVVTDFLVMAATLIEIKAKATLPVEAEETEQNDDYLDPEEEIRRCMIEYQMFKQKAEDIKIKETLNRFYREPCFTDDDARISIVGFNLEKLMQAYAKVMYKANKIDEITDFKVIDRDEFTVSQQLDCLVHKLILEKEVAFFSLFKDDYTRGEVITTFLALLQLVGKQFATIKQDDSFGDINIAVHPDCNPEEFDYSVLAMEENEVG